MHRQPFIPVVVSRKLQQTRRSVLRGALAFAVTSGLLPLLRPATSACHADVATPDGAASELAGLGKRIAAQAPATASRLEGMARKAAGLAPAAPVDWRIADRARVILTEPARIAAEWERGNTVFVDGLLLSNSEAASALLYAAAASPRPRTPAP